ncbi:MAG: hypothetical protein ACPGQD_02255, partial [Planctomycetota bacterium]
MSALERVFHGWDSAFLPKFIQGLLAQHGPNLGEFTIALPGRRAGRRLLELLVAEAPPAWTPPRILTLAQLSDQLTRWPLPRADDSLRELAWLAAERLVDNDLSALAVQRHLIDKLPAITQNLPTPAT